MPYAALAQAAGTQIQGAQDRNFAREQYERQYADALHFWEMQNEYNHPKAQMERLDKAGLNPHLVYGSGQAQQPAAKPQQPTSHMVKHNHPFEGVTMAQGLAATRKLEAEAESREIENFKEKSKLGGFSELDESSAFDEYGGFSGIHDSFQGENPSISTALERSFEQDRKEITRAAREHREWEILLDTAHDVIEQAGLKTKIDRRQAAKLETEIRRITQQINIDKFFEDMVRRGQNPKSSPYWSTILNIIEIALRRIGVDVPNQFNR